MTLIYYSATHNIVVWCELRQAMRNFRTDRVSHSLLEPAHFHGQGENLRRQWIDSWTEGGEA